METLIPLVIKRSNTREVYIEKNFSIISLKYLIRNNLINFRWVVEGRWLITVIIITVIIITSIYRTRTSNMTSSLSSSPTTIAKTGRRPALFWIRRFINRFTITPLLSWVGTTSMLPWIFDTICTENEVVREIRWSQRKKEWQNERNWEGERQRLR